MKAVQMQVIQILVVKPLLQILPVVAALLQILVVDYQNPVTDAVVIQIQILVVVVVVFVVQILNSHQYNSIDLQINKDVTTSTHLYLQIVQQVHTSINLQINKGITTSTHQ